MPEPTAATRRRRLVLGLRGLMLLVLVVGGGIGWMARRASIQRRAVDVIERAGGSVTYDHEVDAAGNRIHDPRPGRPAWLGRAVGDELFQEVIGVALHDYHLMEIRPGDDVLAAVATHDRVESLDVNMLSITDAGLAHLTRLRRLKELQLALDSTTDDGLASLAELPALENLTLLLDEGKLIRPYRRPGRAAGPAEGPRSSRFGVAHPGGHWPRLAG